MITTPNNGNFSNNLTFAQSQSNALPSWLSFDGSTGNITSTNPGTLGSDSYTITNTYTSVYNSLLTLTTDLNITVIEFITPNTTDTNTTDTNTTDTNTTDTNTTQTNTTETNSTNDNSEDDDKYCFGISSGVKCDIIITAIVLTLIVPIIAIAVIVYCKCKKAANRDNRVNVIQICNQDNGQHQSMQQLDQEPMQLQDVGPEAQARGINVFYQTPDNQL